MTASEKDVSDPQWSPDGRRLAYVRDDGDPARRCRRVAARRLVTDHPAGNIRAPLVARRAAPRLHLAPPRLGAGLGRRRADPPPRPAGGRAPARPSRGAVTAAGLDVDEYAWSADGDSAGHRGAARRAPSATPRGSRSSTYRRRRRTSRRRRRRLGVRRPPGCPTAGCSSCPTPTAGSRSSASSPTGRPGRRAHGRRAWSTASRAALYGLRRPALARREPLRPLGHPRRARRPRRRARSAAARRPSAAGAARRRCRRPTVPRGHAVQPWPGVWRSVGWLPDGGWVAAVGESQTRPQDLWLLPVPGRRTGRAPGRAS